MRAPLPRGAFSNPEEFCDALFRFYASAGQSRYDEAVTQLEHALQTAALAERATDETAHHVAALLHDVGHLLMDEHDAHTTFLSQDLRHETVGARFLRLRFGPRVSEPVALHVTAKRYLVSTDADYASALSEASTRSLRLQGGPMTTDEAKQFLTQPDAQAAIALRRWDDAAKQPNIAVPDLEHWRAAIVANAAGPGRT